jgi:hypothetical protein
VNTSYSYGSLSRLLSVLHQANYLYEGNSLLEEVDQSGAVGGWPTLSPTSLHMVALPFAVFEGWEGLRITAYSLGDLTIFTLCAHGSQASYMI